MSARVSFRIMPNIGDIDIAETMKNTMNFTGYNPRKMGSDTVNHVAFSFHKEANWYKDCCSENNSLDYYAKLYNFLDDEELKDFWNNLADCFNQV